MDNADSSRAIGSASVLRGSLYPLSLFVSEPGEPWTQRAKTGVISKSRRAEAWLCREAARYQVDLNFHNGGNFGFESDIVIDWVPGAERSLAECTDWINRVLARVGWSSSDALRNWIRRETRCDGVHVLIYANQQGRSHAMPYSCGRSPLDSFLEGAICYRRHDQRSALSATIIAHEILHLYGAWDLYETAGVSRAQAEQAARHFPNDIMCRFARNINDVNVDKLTAWRVGWVSTAETWYEYFRPST